MHAGFTRTGLSAGIAAAALGLAMNATPAHATSFTFMSGSGQQINNESPLHTLTVNTNGTVSGSGTTVSLSAWTINDPDTGTPTPTFAGAVLGYYSVGLGVCNASEGGPNCESPDHQVDNSGGHEDFVLLQFSSAVSLSSLTVATIDDGGVSGNDFRDVTYWVGNLPSASSLDNDTLAGLGTLGQLSCLTPPAGSVGGGTGHCTGDNGITFNNINSGSGNFILIGASSSGDNDEFKIQGLTVNTVTTTSVTPEPGSVMLLGTGLLGAALGLRRRMRKS